MAEEKKDAEKGEGGEATAAAPAKSKKKKFLIIGGVVFLLIAVGAPVAFFMLKKAPQGGEHEAAPAGEEIVIEGADDEDELDEGEAALGGFLPLETFVVNLSGGKFIRIQVQLEFMERDIPARFYSRLAIVRDGIIAMLTNRTEADVITAKGKESLKHEMRDIINEVMKKEEVRNIYFTQFVVQ